VDECKPLPMASRLCDRMLATAAVAAARTCPIPRFPCPDAATAGFAATTAAAQGLTPVHFSAQPKPFLVTEATASVHFSAQPETFLPMRPLSIAHTMCSRQAENWTSVVQKRCLR